MMGIAGRESTSLPKRPGAKLNHTGVERSTGPDQSKGSPAFRLATKKNGLMNVMFQSGPARCWGCREVGPGLTGPNARAQLELVKAEDSTRKQALTGANACSMRQVLRLAAILPALLVGRLLQPP